MSTHHFPSAHAHLAAPRSPPWSLRPPAGASAPSSPNRSSTTSHPSPSAAAACRQLRLPARHRPGPPRAVRLDAAGAAARRARGAQPRRRLRARPGRADHHHRQHVVLLWAPNRSSSCCWPRSCCASTSRPRSPPGSRSPSLGVLLVVYQPGATGGRRRHHAHPGLGRLLRGVHGADPAPAARRLLAERGARPAGRGTGVRRRPGDGRRPRRRHRLGPRRAGRRDAGWARRSPGSCTTGSGFWFFVTGLRQVPASYAARSCRSSRSSA